MELNEQLRMVAEYMGGKSRKETPDWYYYLPDIPHRVHIMGMQYHTSFDWLIPVAKKVADELQALYNSRSELRSTLLFQSGKLSNYTLDYNVKNLFNSVVDNITFLNELKHQK